VEAELRAVDPSASPVREDDELDWFSQGNGLEISADPDSDRITTVFMFAEGTDDYEQFGGDLPGGIGFDWDRARIGSALGKPSMSGPEHDRWELDDYAIIVEYDDVGRVTSVTVTTE
jgi:hypothetical protein